VLGMWLTPASFHPLFFPPHALARASVPTDPHTHACALAHAHPRAATSHTHAPCVRTTGDAYVFNATECARRTLKQKAIGMLSTLEDPGLLDMILQRFREATNMTDQVGPQAWWGH